MSHATLLSMSGAPDYLCIEVPKHSGHPQHTLVLLPNVPNKWYNIFRCKVCKLYCNGYVYSYVQCEYYIDVTCAFIPEKITHQAHPNHFLRRIQPKLSNYKTCPACGYNCAINSFSFRCLTCDFEIHSACALLLPQTIRHKYNKHPLNRS